MRFSYLISSLLLLLVPFVSAEPAAASSGTTTSTSTTTITRTVVRATQTSTIRGTGPSTSTSATSTIGGGSDGLGGSSTASPTSAQSSLPPYSYLGNSASIERGNWNVAVMAGAAAVVLGYAL